MPHFRVTLERFACKTLQVSVEAPDATLAQARALRFFGQGDWNWQDDPENVSPVMVREVERSVS